MRTYGRITNDDGSKTWVEVQTDAAGFDDYVWITTLAQVLLLNLGESPFYANYGIPSEQSIIQQIFPDFYVTRTQTQFAGHFASLLISKVNNPEPTYRVAITNQQGVKMAAEIPI